MNEENEKLALSRRSFIKAGAAGTAVAALSSVAGRVMANDELPFDKEHDIVVVGGGGSGLPTALFSRWLGNDVVILEKAGSPGGTAAKAAFWYWVPNNKPMRDAGLVDDKADYMRYVARLTRPQSYDASLPKLGLSDWEYEMCEAIYESASPAAELLAERDALPYRHCPDVPDYWSELPEDKAKKGRVLVPKEARPSMSDGGRVAIRTLTATAKRDGVQIRTGERVVKVILNSKGEAVGVEVETEEGTRERVKARKAVIFATGGFTHDPELRRNFLNAPVYGGCAALTNEGDFIRISSELGVQLRNMNYAWSCPILLEKALAKDGSMSGIFTMTGDSMLMVNKYGKRVVNEKTVYNEMVPTFFQWDGDKAEYPNLVMFSIWDQHAQDNCGSDEYGSPIVPKGGNDRHVVRGETLEELAKNIAERLDKHASDIGGMKLSPEFNLNLKATLKRFNELAKKGKDLDFHRGELAIQGVFNGPVKADRTGNLTMYPLAEKGPYYAALITGGNLDTKGGPKTNSVGQVLNNANAAIPGLYGVGNCVASASGRAYWAGGSTLGPIIAFAYRAANQAHKEPSRS
ncbi:FAD-dependent oxidoreductase [Pseudomonas sp. PCH199]|uniref:FAD-dependent oxidoreductase n=1 Tax=unclassified Pseudomonas TaxID=196821 RepID=UPI000BD16816|nr:MULTISPECIES: FAD-dependent oxidoreductase [unclassified Pseudomonas]MCW8275095.1 FAD-dependent oxidoreductase [Pseudomonas sp. PCH199]PAM84766.1 FAD-binding dehydrogenase [Pseudomonas sp. ERMR1:02]